MSMNFPDPRPLPAAPTGTEIGIRQSLYRMFSLICVTIAIFATAAIASAQTTVYNAVPATLAPSYPSQPFQAQQTRQFGDYVHLAGTNRALNSVTFTMVTWAPNSDWPLMPAGGWNHPFTINIYNVAPGAPLNTLGSLIATSTQSKLVPWRPAADPSCIGPDAGKWKSGGVCYNGYAFNLTFDMSSVGAVLPNDVIVGIAYNTETWGYSPIGVGGPYNSLNVGTTPGPPSVGTDDSLDRVFWDTLTAGWYTDGGVGGVGIFREDTAWTGYGTIPIQITATTPTTTNLVVQPNSPYFDSNNVTGVAGDFAPGFAGGSLASNGLAKTDMYFTPQTLFGRDVNIGEIKSMSYFTKTGAIHSVDPRDWFLAIYTKPYAGDVSSPSWYGDRIGSEPYFSSSLTDPANTWNQWNTDPGNNRLRFFESTAGAPGATFGSYTDPNWSTFKSGNALSGQPYAGHPILFFSLQTASAWSAGFTGKIDGYRVELQDGSVATVNFEACSSVSMPSLTTLTGIPIAVPVNTDDMTGRGAISADFRVTYNPAVLSLAAGPNFGVTVGTVGNSNGGHQLTVANPSSGTLIISLFGANEFQGAGPLVNLNFNVIGAPGTTSPMNFTSFNYNEGVPCTITTNGLVTVLGGTIAGNVTYWNAARPVPGATLNGAGAPPVTTNTDALGAYLLSGFGAGAYTITPSRAAETSGTAFGMISGFDASKIAQHVVGTILVPLNADQLVVADVSGSNTITSYDAALIARFAVGLPNYGSTGTWKFVLPSNTHATVWTNITGENYVARLMGDVSGNWSAGGPVGSRPAPIDGEKPLAIAAPVVTAHPGTTLTVPVAIGNTTGKGVFSYQFDLRYDPSVIEPAAVPTDVAGTISEGYLVTVNPIERGLLRVVAFGATPLVGQGQLVNLRFNVVGQADSSSDLTWQNFGLNEGNIYFATGNGRVTVTAASNNAAINGRLLTSGGQGVVNARVSITDTTGQTRTVISSSFGYFQFAGLEVGQTYNVSVVSRRYTFAPQTVSVTDNAVDLDLIAQP